MILKPIRKIMGTGSAWGFLFLDQARCSSREAEYNWHANLNYALNIVVEGAGTFQTQDGSLSRLGPGSIYQHLPEPPHTKNKLIWESNEVEEVFILINRRFYERLRPLQLFPKQELLPPQPMHRIENTLERLTSRLERTPPPAQFELNRQALAGTVTFLSELFDLIETGLTSVSSDPLIARVCKQITSDPRSRQPFPDLAHTTGISYSALRKRFKKSMGIPLSTYRVRTRINAAHGLLHRMNVTEVAEQLGYPDAFTFSAQFKRITGMSPSLYRTEHATSL